MPRTLTPIDGPWSARRLPPTGAMIETARGRFVVDEALVETREHPDTARGFVFARVLGADGTLGTRRQRIMPHQITSAVA